MCNIDYSLIYLGERFDRRSFDSPFKADSDEGELKIIIIWGKHGVPPLSSPLLPTLKTHFLKRVHK